MIFDRLFGYAKALSNLTVTVFQGDKLYNLALAFREKLSIPPFFLGGLLGGRFRPSVCYHPTLLLARCRAHNAGLSTRYALPTPWFV
jgi:hypothetical protein